MRVGGPAIHPSILIPLLIMGLGFMAYFLSLLILRARSEIAARKIRNLRLAKVEA